MLAWAYAWAWAWAWDPLLGRVGVKSLAVGLHKGEVHTLEEMDVHVEEQFLRFLKDKQKEGVNKLFIK